METRRLGKAGFDVSALSFGTSSLGGVFHDVDESEAIAAVHAALDAGIDYIDVAPAYGGTWAETVLGKALRGVPRHRFRLSTKVGKTTNPERYGEHRLDYGRTRSEPRWRKARRALVSTTSISCISTTSNIRGVDMPRQR